MRVGLLAYGFVHLLVAWVAVRLVLGRASSSATGRGARRSWCSGRDPEKSGGLDQSLRELLGGTLGPPAVIVAGVGIGCFGLYLFARSRHLDGASLTS